MVSKTKGRQRAQHTVRNNSQTSAGSQNISIFTWLICSPFPSHFLDRDCYKEVLTLIIPLDSKSHKYSSSSRNLTRSHTLAARRNLVGIETLMCYAQRHALRPSGQYHHRCGRNQPPAVPYARVQHTACNITVSKIIFHYFSSFPPCHNIVANNRYVSCSNDSYRSCGRATGTRRVAGYVVQTSEP